jgi:predicted AlkP superfamily phosphohydrolase/phosphomutase
MRYLNLIIVTLAAILVPDAMAANPIDMIPASLQENLNTGDLEKKAVEHYMQGNLTQEHINQEINVTRGQIKKDAINQITQNLNVTAEQLEQKAKEELTDQLNQRVQQPGFESVLAIMGVLGVAFILRGRN